MDLTSYVGPKAHRRQPDTLLAMLARIDTQATRSAELVAELTGLVESNTLERADDERVEQAAIALSTGFDEDIIPTCDIGLSTGFDEGFSKLANILDLHDGEVEKMWLEDEGNLVALEQEYEELKSELSNVNDIIRGN